MRSFKSKLYLLVVGVLVLGLTAPAVAKDRFEMEVEKETEAIKLVRDVRRGGYDVVSTSELQE